MKLTLRIPRPYAITPKIRVPANATIWLTICLSLTIGWHIPNIPFWTIAAGFALCLWRLLHDWRNISLPGKKMKIIITLTAALIIWLNFGTLLGRDPGISALIIFSSMKLLELKTDRDFMLTVYLCFFLLLGNFLYDQAITYFIFMIVLTFLLTSAVLRLHFFDQQNSRRKGSYFKKAFKILLLAIPLTTILFLFFPRTPGFFWNLRPFMHSSHSPGFREHVYLGEVARIIRSKDKAFRVIFPEHNIPEYKNLYFRGLVLWYTDGRVWFLGSFRSYSAENHLIIPGAIKQEIILEPQKHAWLFALDTPHTFPRWSRQIPGQIFRSPLPVHSHIRYQVESTPHYQPSLKLYKTFRKYALQLPRRVSPKLRALVSKWEKASKNETEIINAALDYFKNEGFVYTLNPDRLDPQNSYEDFLLNKKRGFCEHFATSFALLMRIAKIPCRVILGYHGGKFNPVGNHLTVRQMDAHAWVEVWLDGKGWQRVDPTAFVAPDRINYGIEVSQSVSETGGSEEDRNEALNRALNKNIFKQAIDTIKDVWETIEIKWSLWIISYNRFQQWNFLKFLGALRRNFIILIILTLSAVMVLVSIIRFFLRKEIRKKDPLPQLYQRFCKKMAAKGLVRYSWEGPLDFKKRAVNLFANKAEQISKISELYIKYRYGRDSCDLQQLKHLKTLIQHLKI